EKMASLVPDLKAVFPAHNAPLADPVLLTQLRDALGRVLAGDVDPVPVPDGNVEFRFDGFGLLMREDYHSIPADQGHTRLTKNRDLPGPRRPSCTLIYENP
ncbi:MAG: hypothetical protein WBN07_07420, partial [Woeseiaceae bacterium]